MAVATTESRSLVKTMRWWDGFALALANPAFLLASLGYSIGVLGGWTAIALWALAMFIGVMQSYLYAEMATMFPEKSGGIALYAHEGWRRHVSIVGPIATFGYWFAWSGVLAIFGLTIGTLIQQQWFPHEAWTFNDGLTHVGLPHLIAGGLIIAVWLFNIFGVRPAVWLAYVTGAMLIVDLLVLIVAPFVTGDWHGPNLTWQLGDSGPWWKVALVWLYVMGWSAYGTESCAAFAPEYHDTPRDTAKALKSSSMFSLGVYALVPLGLAGIITQKDALSNPVGIFSPAFNHVVGSGFGDVLVVFLVASLFLSMSTATADGGRALYGIAGDGMSIRQLHHLNRFGVPGRAMTVDLIVNLVLVFAVGQTLSILFAGNLGYFVAIIAALSGFLLLRRDRPAWPRAIKRGRIWVPIAAVLLTANIVFLVFGVTNPKITGYGGTKEVLIGVGVLALSLVLFAYRRVVQDGQPIRLREAAPTVPDHAHLSDEPAIAMAESM